MPRSAAHFPRDCRHDTSLHRPPETTILSRHPGQAHTPYNVPTQASTPSTCSSTAENTSPASTPGPPASAPSQSAPGETPHPPEPAPAVHPLIPLPPAPTPPRVRSPQHLSAATIESRTHLASPAPALASLYTLPEHMSSVPELRQTVAAIA